MCDCVCVIVCACVTVTSALWAWYPCVQVQQLERTIHDTHDEMSKRMQRVDSTLLKYEAEIKERTGQVG